MHPFAYHRAASEADALAAGAMAGSKFIAGGTTLVDLTREGVEAPARIVDINALPYREVTLQGGVLRIGALARMSEVAAHPMVADRFPVIAEALLASASPQLRNMASIGGNVMQRTRCPYFRDAAMPMCNKRIPGSGCGAREGHSRMQAIFGTSDACIAAHASDLAVALVALDAQLVLHGPDGERRMALEDFLLLPGATPEREHALAPGELIVAVEVPATAGRSAYLKVRDRASYEFALVSVAIVLETAGGSIRRARIAAGGVGTRPWRLRNVEAALAGRPIGSAGLAAVAAQAGEGAAPQRENAFKVRMLANAVRRAVEMVEARA